jgi:hypothetical protein
LNVCVSRDDGCRVSVVVMATRLGSGRCGVQIPLRVRDFYVLQNVQSGFGGNGLCGFLAGDKTAGA